MKKISLLFSIKNPYAYFFCNSLKKIAVAEATFKLSGLLLPKLARGTPKQINTTVKGEQIYKKGDISVSAFLVDHDPVIPAFGYRMQYKGCKLVISGDTKVIPSLGENAKNVEFKGNIKLIEKIDKNEQILKNADAVLQEHDLTLIRSAVTLTVSGELEEPIYDDLEEEDFDDDSETYELLVNFNVQEEEFGLYVPLDPFFIVGKLQKDGGALLIEDDEFDRVQPLIESELEKTAT